jgi:hypothetical protein
MSVERTFGVDIFFPASGSVVEVRRPLTRAECSEPIEGEYVTLSLEHPEFDMSSAVSGCDSPAAHER